jgi:hypothetical protein
MNDNSVPPSECSSRRVPWNNDKLPGRNLRSDQTRVVDQDKTAIGAAHTRPVQLRHR